MVSVAGIRADVKERICTLTVERPEKFNAFDVPMVLELREKIERAASDPRVAVVVLTGQGDAFCAGGDVGAMRAALDEDAPALFRDLTQHFHHAVTAIAHMEKPVVAAVNGIAAGGGMSLALACDLRIASDRAKLRPAYFKLGVGPDGGLTHTLTQLSPGHAARILLLDETIDAAQALAIGLVHRVVPHAEFAKAIEETTHRLTRMPAFALGKTKRLLRLAPHHSLEEQLALERKFISESAGTADFREGVAAFFEKREPRFGGAK